MARAPRTPRQRTTNRTVHFFRLHCGDGGDGRLRPYQMARASGIISDLSFANGDRYIADGDDAVVGIWPDGTISGAHRLLFAKVRRAALPRIERAGRLTGLNIPGDAGLAEFTHVVAFSDGIVGVLFNSHGPRPLKLASYLSAKCSPPLDPPILSPLLRPDIAALLGRMQNIRLVDIAIQHQNEAILAEHDSGLADILSAARMLAGAQRVRLVLQPEPYAREGLGGLARDLVRRIARIAGVADIVDRLAIKGFDPRTGSNVDLDVLRELLVSKQEVAFLNPRSRDLDDESAYEAVTRARGELDEELRKAALAHL